MSYREHHADAHRALRFSVLTVSDTKGPKSDASGDALARILSAKPNTVTSRAWCVDDIARIRDAARELLSDEACDALVVTGGTGVTPRDVTPEALRPLFERELPGFGEHFRALSAKTIGSGAILSRATAGIVAAGRRRRLLFLLPGAPEACTLAAKEIILREAPHLLELANRGGEAP